MSNTLPKGDKYNDFLLVVVTGRNSSRAPHIPIGTMTPTKIMLGHPSKSPTERKEALVLRGLLSCYFKVNQKDR